MNLCCFAFGLPDCARKLLASGAQGKQCFYQEFHGDAGITGFHFRYAGLTGVDSLGQFRLAKTLLLSKSSQLMAQRQFHFDEGDFLVGQIKKILCIAELPAFCFQLFTFSLSHCRILSVAVCKY